MAPGYEDAQKLKATKASSEYWAKDKAGAQPNKVA
jgi:hypothetical protein